MRKILFISHEASRTGAPLVILNLIKWINLNTKDFHLDILLLKGGSLENNFRKECNNVFLVENEVSEIKFSKFILTKIKKKFGLKNENKNEKLYSKLITNNYFLIYANTVVTIPQAVKLKNSIFGVKLLVHVHELTAIIKQVLPDFSFYIGKVDHVIAASDIVKENLIENFEVPKENISRIYECSKVNIDVNENNNENNFVVGASGTVHWRKGHDLFIQVARYMNMHYPRKKIVFHWIGSISEKERIIVEEDLRKLKLTNVNFVGEVENPHDYYNDFDMFLMTSREDPFPLVCIEVGMLEKPIICFEGATGTQEVLQRGGGFIVPYLSIEAMAEKIIEYYKNPNLLKKHGMINKKEFAKFTPDEICPKIFNVINNEI